MPRKVDVMFTATLHGATRKGTSKNGNPTWQLHTSEGDYLTETDGSIGYEVANVTNERLSSSLVGRRVTFSATRNRRVWDMRLATTVEDCLAELHPASCQCSQHTNGGAR